MITPDTVSRPSRIRGFASIGLVVVGVVMLVVVAAWALFPSLSIPSTRLVEWQLGGYGGPGFDPTTAQTTTVIPVYIAYWPVDYAPDDDSWLATPAVVDAPWGVTITLHTSDAYAASIEGTTFGLYDTGGWVKVQLKEPLGDRSLSDGSRFPPEARTYPGRRSGER